MRSAYGSADTHISDYFAKADVIKKFYLIYLLIFIFRAIEKYGSIENVSMATSKSYFEDKKIDEIHAGKRKEMIKKNKI